MVLHCVSHLIIIIIIINVLFSFFFYFSKYILSYRNLESDLLFILPKQNPLHKKRKKITRQNQNLNNENYHRLNHIVKKPFNPTRLERPPFSQEIHTHTNLSNWHFSGCTPRFPPRFSVYTAMTKQDYR